MPGFDKTGPEGEGAMTGRRMGRCTGYGAKNQKSTQPENPEELPENLRPQRFWIWPQRARPRFWITKSFQRRSIVY
jgi:hypothetical protein